MASLEFDQEINGLYLRLRKGKVSSSEPLADNIVLDLDAKDKVVGIELLLPPSMTKEVSAQLAPRRKRNR